MVAMAELLLALLLVLACAPAFLRPTPDGRTVSWIRSRMRAFGAWIDKMDEATGHRRSVYDSSRRLLSDHQNARWE
jgi:hypothetical protein